MIRWCSALKIWPRGLWDRWLVYCVAAVLCRPDWMFSTLVTCYLLYISHISLWRQPGVPNIILTFNGKIFLGDRYSFTMCATLSLLFESFDWCFVSMCNMWWQLPVGRGEPSSSLDCHRQTGQWTVSTTLLTDNTRPTHGQVMDQSDKTPKSWYHQLQ